MTGITVDRTDWRRVGSGGTVPLTDAEVRHDIYGLAKSCTAIRGPALLSIAGTGSLLLNAMLPLMAQEATAAPAVIWPRPVDLTTGAKSEPTAQLLAQELRRRSGLTNEEIAPLAGVSRRSFQAWLAGGSISARKEMRLRHLVGALTEIGDLEPQAMRARLLDKNRGSVRPYDLLAEGRFNAGVALATGRRLSATVSRSTERESLAEQFDRDQGSLPKSGGRLNRALSKPLRR